MRAALVVCCALSRAPVVRTPLSLRFLHMSAPRLAAKKVDEPAQAAAAAAKPQRPASSCSPDMVLTGLNYLKGQVPVLALKDEDYPDWLWTITEAREIPDDGPGGQGEKMRMRIENKQRIKERNFMSKQ
ncbi:mitochondrial ribosomal protein L37-domain-containing protein [Auriculariales sp. MPI-PUGE-AT-0066]|nr:mitochondrial ribosomal protein L37-domain-containing protein [Auriculariales sp. MPI-PUGE-AT-0066]